MLTEMENSRYREKNEDFNFGTRNRVRKDSTESNYEIGYGDGLKNILWDNEYMWARNVSSETKHDNEFSTW